jgi:hypothetical protein
MTYIRYKYKIGDIVLVHNIANIGLHNKIGIVIDREHPTNRANYNEYKLVVCGISDFPMWFSETSIRKFE